jgi:hypothetical protein
MKKNLHLAAWGFTLAAALPVLAQTTAPNPGAATAKPPASAASEASSSKPAAVAPTSGLKAYAEVIKDSKELPGHFTLHQKDEKVWLAITPEQLNQPFFFTVNVSRSVGERGLYGSQMGRSYLTTFRRVGNQIQLVALNTRFHAKPGTPQAQFVSESFSESLLGSAAVVSLKHPDTQAVLVEANGLLITDIPGYQTELEEAFRMPFALDAKNSEFSSINNTPDNSGLEVRAHFSVSKLAAAPLTPSPTPSPPPPRTTPDARSLFTSFYYNLAKLPAQPLTPRLADERIGYFVMTRTDYTEDTQPKTRQHWIKRWRLEKQDPTAALSAPKQPVTFWLDKNIPVKYRESVRQAVLEWNNAFEKIGYHNAIAVQQQSDTDSFNNMDARHASVRWFTGSDIGFAIGPSHADPRTGEILDADMGMSDVFARGARRLVSEDLRHTHSAITHDATHCDYGQQAQQELDFGMDLLEARGLDMDGPKAEALAQTYVKSVMMHEVGHVLGLRHNFRASTVYSLKELHNPAFAGNKGLSTSIMDYIPFNLTAEGQPPSQMVMSTLGEYDHWAIEYGYREIAPADEAKVLAQIASRAREPQLAFATDEDAGYGPVGGVDPLINRFDLGNDPLAYYKHRMQLSKELWRRIERMKLADGESYERLTRSFMSGFRAVSNVAPLAAKYVGGVLTRRDRAGGLPLAEPVPAARQQEALNLISRDFFQADSFRFKPDLLARLAQDPMDRESPRQDLSVPAMVLGLQKAVLDPIMSAPTAQRLAESPLRDLAGKNSLTLAAVYTRLQSDIWSEVASGQQPDLLRRNLQREHLRRSMDSLLRPAANMPADVRSVQRLLLSQLADRLEHRLKGGTLQLETQAHYKDALGSIRAALSANLQRSG